MQMEQAKVGEEKAKQEAAKARHDAEKLQRMRAKEQAAAKQKLANETAKREQEEAARIKAELAKEEYAAKLSFHNSIVGTHKHLSFEVLAVRKLQPSEELLDCNRGFIDRLPTDLTVVERQPRNVFHSCTEKVIPLIEKQGLKPSQCRYCINSGASWVDHDSGWFGDHSQGVYVSKHADYTFKYRRLDQKLPEAGDEGKVIMLELITGKVKHFKKQKMGAKPKSTGRFNAYLFSMICFDSTETRIFA